MFSEEFAEARGVSVPTEDERRRAMATAVKEARAARGFSQAALASKVGVDVKTIGRIENGQMVPNLATIWALADALNAPVTLLVGASDSESTRIAGVNVLVEGDSEVATLKQLQSYLDERQRRDHALNQRLAKIEVALGIPPQEPDQEL